MVYTAAQMFFTVQHLSFVSRVLVQLPAFPPVVTVYEHNDHRLCASDASLLRRRLLVHVTGSLASLACLERSYPLRPCWGRFPLDARVVWAEQRRAERKRQAQQQ